jgi:hypothetical protein
VSGVRRRRKPNQNSSRARCYRAGEPDFVDQEQIVAQHDVDGFADGVVGQAAVEGVGQVGGGEVATFVPGVDDGDVEGDQWPSLPNTR